MAEQAEAATTGSRRPVRIGRPFGGHTGSVFAVAVTANGEEIVSGGDDGTIRMSNRRTGEERTTLTGSTDWVRAVT